MSGKANLHTHTLFCDGKDTPEELVLAALEKGFACLGFSGHSYLPGGEEWSMSPEKEAAYRAEVARLREAYRSRLEILCGVEQDIWSPGDTAAYDYVIGSVHSVRKSGRDVTVDWDARALREAVDSLWGGDWYAMAEDYYRLVSQVVAHTGADIIGHLDLVTRHNEGGVLFDERHPRYVAAALAAADALLKTGKPFELNTGAMARGYRTEAYPAPFLRDYIARNGGRFLLTSDCHDRDKLDFAFERFPGVPTR